MHYRSWGFLALFSVASVSAAEEAAPLNDGATSSSKRPTTSKSSAMKEKLKLLRCGTPPRGKKPKGAPPPLSGPIPEQLAASDISAVVTLHEPAIRRCVEAQKAQEPDRSGRLTLRWGIDKSGSTKDVTCTTPELCQTGLARCLTAQIQEWRFPPHATEGQPVSFPFTF